MSNARPTSVIWGILTDHCFTRTFHDGDRYGIVTCEECDVRTEFDGGWPEIEHRANCRVGRAMDALATLAQVEAERDGLEALVRFFADAATPEDFAEIMDVFTGHANLGPESDAAWAALARLAEAPKATP